MDVRVRGKWDGVIVVDDNGICIGVYIRRRIETCPLPFAPSEIEDIRNASLWNLVLAAMPFDLYDAAVFTVVLISPVTLVLGWMVFPLFALFSVVACGVAIYVMYLAPGFIFTRFPVAFFGFGQIVWASVFLLRSLW